MKRALCIMALLAAPLAAVQPDADSLLGIHWYPNTDSLSVGQTTDVEAMTDNTGVWITEITHLNTAAAPPWDQPGYHAGHAQKAASGKGHSFIYRIQPYWDANVPHPDDPYTVAQFAEDAKSAANTLKDWVHVWQVGNEVNINDENKRWNAGANNYSGAQWQPTPEQYADTYIAVRDKIHEHDALVAPLQQIVLMQAVSPGNVIPGVRYMDGNEFLFRQIDAVADKSKIDGFALHGYAEPGGANFGVDGFMDSIREQLMIIDSFGLGDRPVFITEFNKHMPNATEANIGAKFLHRAFTAMNDWNNGAGGIWPGIGNHNIVSATWFVFPGGRGWDDYALGHWKTQIASTDHELNPWYSFRHAAMNLNYSAGAHGGGPTAPPLQNALWFEDTFDAVGIDQTPPLPDWHLQPTGGGSMAQTGTGELIIQGNGGAGGGGSIYTRGYAFSDFRIETTVTVTNAARSSTAVPEANFEVRVREGSKGYSLTFFTSQSPNNPNTIMLRRVNDWVQIGSFAQVVGGDGIASGDTYHISIQAEGTTLRFTVHENASSTPVVDWTVNDGGQRVGYIRVGTYNLNQARVERVAVGGPDWTGLPSGADNWHLY